MMRSKDLISFSVSGVPTFGNRRPCWACASTTAGMAAAMMTAGARILSKERIGDAPIASDFPGLLGREVDGARFGLAFPIRHVDAPVLAHLRERQLDFARLVGGPRHDHRFLSVPFPIGGEARVR